MRRRLWLALPLTLALAACADNLVAPSRAPSPDDPLNQERPQRGTGLALENVVEWAAGRRRHPDQPGRDHRVLHFPRLAQGERHHHWSSVTVPGLTVTDDFTTDVLVSSSSGGRCDLVTIDLAPLNADLLELVRVDIPTANVSGQGSGAIGPLLCNLGRIVNTVGGGVVRGLVNALNALLQ